jgi:hypothetical protein
MSPQNQRILIKKLEEAASKNLVKFKGTVKTPEIYLNYDEGEIYLSGRSIPENAKQLFHPILQWVEKYIEKPREKTKVVFKFEYFNTASSKMIFELINNIKKLKERGKDVTIEWHYLEEDDDILDSGETFQEISGLEFQFHSYQ